MQTLNTIESITLNTETTTYTIRHEVASTKQVTYAKQVYTENESGRRNVSRTTTIAHTVTKEVIDVIVESVSTRDARAIVTALMDAGKFSHVEDYGKTRVLRIKQG